MKTNDSTMSWAKLLTVGAVIMVAVFIALFGMVDTAMAQEGPGPYCVQAYRPGAGCTANDVRIEELIAFQLIEGCTVGTIGQMEAVFQALISADGSPNRYDIGIFIDTDGGDALAATSTCFHDFLEPPLTPAPVYGDQNGNGVPDVYNLSPAFIGYWDAEVGGGDFCGDMETNTEVIKVLSQPLRLPCVDVSDAAGNLVPDGFVDVGVCASWDNNTNTTCANVQGAFPGTNSKCSCSRVNLPNQPTAIELASFGAAVQGGDVLLTWETATELDNLGFNVYRAMSRNGERVQVNERLIPSEMSGNAMGAAYTFLDEAAVPGQTYYYWLQDVDVHGLMGTHGPAEATTAVPKALPGRPRPQPIPTLLSVVAGLIVWAVTRL